MFGSPSFASLSTLGPPGYPNPITLATLSNASPIASSLVLPIETALRKTYRLFGCQPYGFKTGLNVFYEKPGESGNLVEEVSEKEVMERYGKWMELILEYNTISMWRKTESVNTWLLKTKIEEKESRCCEKYIPILFLNQQNKNKNKNSSVYTITPFRIDSLFHCCVESRNTSCSSVFLLMENSLMIFSISC